MSVRVASGLEAQYIVAEAQGPTAATLAFVNARRAAGLQAPVTLAGDALMAELRDQRSRDFYLDNHRLGDLRRYQVLPGRSLPEGPVPGEHVGSDLQRGDQLLAAADERDQRQPERPEVRVRSCRRFRRLDG